MLLSAVIYVCVPCRVIKVVGHCYYLRKTPYTDMYSSSLLRRPCAIFFVFPEGGFSILDDLGKLPENFRPPFEEAEEDRFVAELGRDCK